MNLCFVIDFLDEPRISINFHNFHKRLEVFSQKIISLFTKDYKSFHKRLYVFSQKIISLLSIAFPYLVVNKLFLSSLPKSRSSLSFSFLPSLSLCLFFLTLFLTVFFLSIYLSFSLSNTLSIPQSLSNTLSHSPRLSLTPQLSLNKCIVP